MSISIIIISIIIIILISSIIYLYKQVNTIQTIINKDDISTTISKLKIKNLEIEETIKSPTIITSNINSIDENINLNNDLVINSNNISINPNVTLDTTIDMNKEQTKYKDNKMPEILYLKYNDNKEMNIKTPLNEIIYYIYKRLPDQRKLNNKQVESFVDISKYYY